MRYIFILLFFNSWSSRSQQVEILLNAAVRLENAFQGKNALIKYKEIIQLQPNHAQALYKCSELCSRVGAREKEEEKKQEYYDQGLSYARQLLKYHPQLDDGYVALSIAMGKLALIKSGNEKINFVKEIKSNAEMAIKLNPSNYKAWHILGKWHYEITQLNFAEKTILKLFFSGFPEASLQRSIQAYQQAEKLHSDFMLNHLEMAKAFYANDEEKEAIRHLRLVLHSKLRTEDDPIIQKEAASLLKKWE